MSQADTFAKQVAAAKRIDRMFNENMAEMDEPRDRNAYLYDLVIALAARTTDKKWDEARAAASAARRA